MELIDGIREQYNPGRHMHPDEFWRRCFKIGIPVLIITIWGIWIILKSEQKTEKPKTEQSRQKTNSLNK